MPGSTVSGVSDNECVATVPERVLDELAQVVIDKIDQLLDRVTDRAVGAPTPGSAAWELGGVPETLRSDVRAWPNARVYERNWRAARAPNSASPKVPHRRCRLGTLPRSDPVGRGPGVSASMRHS